jgi:hypothetical protein
MSTMTYDDILTELKGTVEGNQVSVIDAHDEPEWLRLFWLVTVFERSKVLSVLFPETEIEDAGYVSLAISALGTYALTKALSVELRRQKRDEEARQYELACATLRADLPPWVRGR